MPLSPALPFSLFGLNLFELACEVLHVLASEQQRLLPLSFARAVVVVVHCARARVYRFAPHRRHGRHKHLPPLPLAPDALHHDDGLLHGISRRRVHNVERPQVQRLVPPRTLEHSVVVAPAIVHCLFAIAAMLEGSQKFASELIFNFNFYSWFSFMT